MADRRAVDDLLALTHPPGEGTGRAATPEPRPTIAASIAVGEQAEEGGIASPIAEIDANARQFHDAWPWESADGRVVLVLEPVKQITSRDANNNIEVRGFDDPFKSLRA